jgi:hypothetical protein
MYLCHPSEASTRYCVIPGSYTPQDWQSLPCAGEELDSNLVLLICSQVGYHWATSPPHWATSPPYIYIWWGEALTVVEALVNWWKCRRPDALILFNVSRRMCPQRTVSLNGCIRHICSMESASYPPYLLDSITVGKFMHKKLKQRIEELNFESLGRKVPVDPTR